MDDTVSGGDIRREGKERRGTHGAVISRFMKGLPSRR